MADCYMEFSETKGKTVDRIRYIYDPSGAPEVDIRFTDGVSLSIKLQLGLKAEGDLYCIHDGDMQTLQHYPAV